MKSVKIVIAAILLLGCIPASAAKVKHQRPAVQDSTGAGQVEDTVYYNTRTGKYHIHSCSAAKSCSNCVDMPISQVRKLHGKPCGLCGGGGIK
jgi:hypothetical protein